MNPAATPRTPAKFLKMEVKFEHPAKGPDRCIDCIHFLPRQHACQIVRGYIEAADWCDRYQERK